MPGAHNAIEYVPRDQAGERVALIADEASRAVAASLEQALLEPGAQPECLLIESVSARPMLAAPRSVLDALERADAGDPVRAAAGRGAGGAHGDRGDGRAAPHPLRAHGRRHAADHVRGDARRLPARRSPQPGAVRPHADGAIAVGRTAGRHRLHGDLRSVAGVGEDQRAHQSALLVEPARPGKSSRRRRRWTARSSATGPRATTSTPSTARLDDDAAACWKSATGG